jgi:hypothetical protein
MKWTAGVNFINILRAAFVCEAQKPEKGSHVVSLFMLSGAAGKYVFEIDP